MAEELELSDYINTYELERFKANTPVKEAEKSERRLLKLGLLTLALLCIIQATLNLSLRLSFHSKADVDPFPFNSPSRVGLCLNEQLRQNSTQLLFCYKNLLREYWVLRNESNFLQKVIQKLRTDGIGDDLYSGSGYPIEELTLT